MSPSRPTRHQVAVTLAAHAGDHLVMEAERIAALETRLARTLALAELVEAKRENWGWITGRCVQLWAERIAAMLDREARRQALQEIPPGQAHLVETEVRRIFEAMRQEAQE